MSVPHPGPRPQEFVFPFAQAQAAVEAIEALIDALASCRRQHDAAAAAVGRGFEGASRDAFERWLADALDVLRMDGAHLAADAEQLRALIGTARLRRAARERQIAAWQIAYTSHQADQRERARLDGQGIR